MQSLTAPPTHASPFHPLPDAGIEALSDTALVAYISAAHAARRHRTAERALAILIWGRLPYIELRVLEKVPAHAAEPVVDKVLESAADRALLGRAGFRGTSVAEFKLWLDRIIARRIADHYRRPEHALTRVRLAEDCDDADAGVQLVARDEADAVGDRLLVDEVLSTLPAANRTAARMTELEGHTAAEVTAALGRSPTWVWKNAERFRSDLRLAVQAAEADHPSARARRMA